MGPSPGGYRIGSVRALTFEAWKALSRDARVEFEELRHSLGNSGAQDGEGHC